MREVIYWEQTCDYCNKTQQQKATGNTVPFTDWVNVEHKTRQGRTTAKLCSDACLWGYIQKLAPRDEVTDA